MSAPTYDLYPDCSNTDDYYRAITELVDDVLEAGESPRALIEDYRQYLQREGRDCERSTEELLLELLIVGVLWVARGREAIFLNPRQRGLVTELVRERRAGHAKQRDTARNGILDFGEPIELDFIIPNVSDLEKLNEWLLASAEYDDEVARIADWLAFLRNAESGARDALKCILTFANAFADQAEQKLGRYTAGVDTFLHEKLPERRTREDAVQCSRRRIEYHLNLFGAELLNRVWRSKFMECKEQTVVLSGCLRRNGDACRGLRDGGTLRCCHCTKGCAVSEVTRLAERYGKRTLAVMHGSDYSRFLDVVKKTPKQVTQGMAAGIIGVACAPGILGAGLRAKDRGLVAQCVVLRQSGCTHWRGADQPTSFDLGELERILSGRDRGSVVRRESACTG